MAVGKPDPVRPDAQLADGLQDAVDIPAGIDDDCLHAGLIPEDGAVLLERGHRHDGGSDRGHARSRSSLLWRRPWRIARPRLYGTVPCSPMSRPANKSVARAGKGSLML